MEILITFGIPTAITSFAVWLLKRYIDKREAERTEKEANTEKLILLMLKLGKANNILAEATARAIQRIPDARCNGDMTAALKKAAEIQQAEKDFLINHGIQHIFNEN